MPDFGVGDFVVMYNEATCEIKKMASAPGCYVLEVIWDADPQVQMRYELRHFDTRKIDADDPLREKQRKLKRQVEELNQLLFVAQGQGLYGCAILVKDGQLSDVEVPEGWALHRGWLMMHMESPRNDQQMVDVYALAKRFDPSRPQAIMDTGGVKADLEALELFV